MASKSHQPEEIVPKLRQVDVLMALESLRRALYARRPKPPTP